MDDVCHDVEIEPLLQPLLGESSDKKSTKGEVEARLDLKANGLWGHSFA